MDKGTELVAGDDTCSLAAGSVTGTDFVGVRDGVEVVADRPTRAVSGPGTTATGWVGGTTLRNIGA